MPKIKDGRVVSIEAVVSEDSWNADHDEGNGKHRPAALRHYLELLLDEFVLESKKDPYFLDELIGGYGVRMKISLEPSDTAD